MVNLANCLVIALRCDLAVPLRVGKFVVARSAEAL